MGSQKAGPTQLHDWLERAADGDRTAFLCFYDATCAPVHAVALGQAYRAGLRGEALHRAAHDAVRARYVHAWRTCGEAARSGFSPLAWLMALHLPETTSDQPVAVAS